MSDDSVSKPSGVSHVILGATTVAAGVFYGKFYLEKRRLVKTALSNLSTIGRKYTTCPEMAVLTENTEKVAIRLQTMNSLRYKTQPPAVIVPVQQFLLDLESFAHNTDNSNTSIYEIMRQSERAASLINLT